MNGILGKSPMGILSPQDQELLKLFQTYGILAQETPRGALTSNPMMMAQALRSRQMRPEPNYPTTQGLLDTVALGTAPVPILGDILGLGADVNRYANDPASRTWQNYGLTGLGLLPFVPSLVGATKGATQTALKMLDNDIAPLMDAAKRAGSFDEFNRGVRQGHLMDLSNQEMHRFGRALPYRGEPYTDIQEILSTGHNPGSYLTTIKYESPATYRAITSPGDEVTVYRAVPKNAGDKIRIGDYVALDERYARMHGESVLGAQQGVPWKLVKERVPKKDIVWGNADFNEWAYSPADLRKQYPSLEDLFESARK